jgi:hypothetical protein
MPFVWCLMQIMLKQIYILHCPPGVAVSYTIKPREHGEPQSLNLGSPREAQASQRHQATEAIAAAGIDAPRIQGT